MCENCNGYTVKLPRGAPCARGDARWIRANMAAAAAFAAGLGVMDEGAGEYGTGESDGGVTWTTAAPMAVRDTPADPPALASPDRWALWPRPRANMRTPANREVMTAQ